MKKVFKKILVNILAAEVRKLRARNDFKVVAVVGSVGKTSTKYAIAHVLGKQYKVQFQAGNYNDILSVPLVFFGKEMPSLYNPFAWIKTINEIRKQSRQPYPYEIVVVELGTDGMGQMREFASYIRSNISVVTAIGPEHMENFPDIDAVAQEELSVAAFSDTLVINSDLVEEKYIQLLQSKVLTFGQNEKTGYSIQAVEYGKLSVSFQLEHGSEVITESTVQAVSIAEVYSAASAAVVGNIFGVSRENIEAGITTLQPVKGRMQLLKGIRNSLIIDETYNASPLAVKSALDSLYNMEAPQKIAILGNMNELGQASASAHQEIGEYCNAKQLDLVVTIGPDANTYLAPAASKKGCKVVTYDSPYDAGEYVRSVIQEGAVILAKGSQNGVFAEESVKLLLENSDDSKNLVRQSDDWLRKKRQQFGVKG